MKTFNSVINLLICKQMAMLPLNAYGARLLAVLLIPSTAMLRHGRLDGASLRLASLKVSSDNVPPDPPPLDAAVARWVDTAMKTYVKERGRTMRREEARCPSNTSNPCAVPVKIAYVFMVYQEIRFPKLWEEFFEGSTDANYTVLVHAMNETLAVSKMPSFFRQRLVNKTGLPSGEWCHFSRIQLALIRRALVDTDVTHVMWISGDAIPLQRAETINADVGNPPMRSFFCVDPLSGSRAEMWSVLARPHALALAMNEDALFDLYQRYDFLCEDEQIFYQPLVTLGVNKESLVDHCIMWTAWGTGSIVGKYFRDVNPNFNSAVLTLPNVSGHHVSSRQFRKRVNSSAHPALWTSVPSDGLQRLMNHATGFFFARKFTSDCIVQSGTKQIPLGDFMTHQLGFRNR